MIRIVNSIQEREAIVAEYLIGGTTYRKLADKHQVDFRALHRWVITFQGKSVKKEKASKPQQQANQTEQLPTDVKQLQEELRKVKLHNELLNAMIDIAEDQLKIDIRKKSGTRR
jgi:transposase